MKRAKTPDAADKLVYLKAMFKLGNRRGCAAETAYARDIRTWDGGIRQFLMDEQCDPEIVERIMADELKRDP